MAPVKNGRHLFNQVPEGYPEPGKTTVYDDSQTIDLDNVALNGGFLVKTLALSIDPYMRGKMRSPEVKSYAPAFTLGEPLDNFGVGVVLRSEHADIKKGDHVYGLFPFQEYFIRPNTEGITVIENKENIPWSYYVGPAGMPGQTAYLAWKAYAKAKKGETVFVTTGAGPVGSLVAQLAKLDGLKVIASAGSDEKVQYMKEIGVDVAFNYKTADTRKILEEHGPIDIYWDNVGGETLEAALDAANPHARFLECGMISGYNSKNPYGIKNLFHVIAKSLTIQGFLIFNLLTPESTAEFYNTVPGMIARGELKFLEDRKRGLDQVGEAILDVQSGKNHGKSVIIVADD